MEKDNYILRGFYRPGFFSLFINGEFSENYDDLSETDLGTFVHEYIHYLQNVTTIFGLRNNIFYFNYLFEVKKYIVENEKINLPLNNIKFSKAIQYGQTWFKLFNGTSDCINPTYDNLKISIKGQTINDINVDSVFIDLYLNGDLINTIIFGNNCVKESMAVLYQQYFDKEVKSYLFPYHSVELLCNVINPELLDDKRKIIALCLVALNSQNCGLTLYDLIHKSHEDKALNGIELYKKYLKELNIQHAGTTTSIKDFLLETIIQFKELLSASLDTEVNHFNLLMENISLAAENDLLPLIEVLYEGEKNNLTMLASLINFYGIPHIRTSNGYNYYPLDKARGQPAMEFIELIGQRIVLDRLLGIDADKIGEMCSLRPQCELSEVELIDDNCYDTQWERKVICPFKIISDNWRLKEKITLGNTRYS